MLIVVVAMELCLPWQPSLQMAMFQSVTSAFIDEFDWLKNKKILLTAALCAFEFLMGIPCITKVRTITCCPFDSVVLCTNISEHTSVVQT